MLALAQPVKVNAQATKITGHWNFDKGDLSATIGKDLEYGDGAAGRVQAHTSFGTTTSFGIPDIGGAPAQVLKYTRDDFAGATDKNPKGFLCQHGMAPNGGGTKVNQFTLIYDLMIPDLHEGDNNSMLVKWEAVDDFTVDGSICVQGNDIGGDETGGIGIGTSDQFMGDGATWIKGGQWQRVVVSVDMAANPGIITCYLDGKKFGDMITGDRWGKDGRHAVPPAIRLFGDGGNNNEVNTFYLKSAQFREGAMTAVQAAALGAASAGGIPHPITTQVVQKATGQWEFDQGDLRATIGKDLEYGDGPTGRVKAQTSFGTTTSFGIPDIGGKPALVLNYTRDEFDDVTDKNPKGYLCQHGMAPNGGGTNVNQFTLIVDLMIPNLHMGDNYNTVVKWEAVDDFNVDGSISIKANDIGGDNTGGIGISGQYTGDGVTWIKGGQWQRLIVAVDMTVLPGIITYYLDGEKFGEMVSGDRWGFDRRHAIPPAVRLFGDGENDNEVNTFYINSVQFREGTVTAAQATALGAATADGIPVPAAPVEPKLATSVKGSDLTISWDAGATGFMLESTATLTNPTWTAVPGVVNASVTVKTSASASYYRLKK